jgi:hypothetical protein
MNIVGWQVERVFQSQRAITHYRTRGFIELMNYYKYKQVLAGVSLASLLQATTQTKCTLQPLSLVLKKLI